MKIALSISKTIQCFVLVSALTLSNCAYLFGKKGAGLHENLPWCVVDFLFMLIPLVVEIVLWPCLPDGKGLVKTASNAVIPNSPEDLRRQVA